MPYVKIFLRAIQWMVFIVLNLLFEVFALLFCNWWVVFFARPIKTDNFLYYVGDPEFQGIEQTLPRWLKWFDTFDASVDAGWAGNYFTEKGTYNRNNLPSYWKRKWYQIRWLYRNCAYGFAYWLLGTKIDTSDWIIHKCDYQPGKKFIFFAYNSQGYFQFIVRLPRGGLNFGWKILNYYSLERREWYHIETGQPWGPEWRTMHVISFNPFKKHTIKAFPNQVET